MLSKRGGVGLTVRADNFSSLVRPRVVSDDLIGNFHTKWTPVIPFPFLFVPPLHCFSLFLFIFSVRARKYR